MAFYGVVFEVINTHTVLQSLKFYLSRSPFCLYVVDVAITLEGMLPTECQNSLSLCALELLKPQVCLLSIWGTGKE